MDSLSLSAFGLTIGLQNRGIDLATLGAAYLVLMISLIGTAAAFVAARSYLVVSPNRATRDYGIYVSVVVSTFLIATVLENELLPGESTTLQYVAVPQLLMLLTVHLCICNRQEPWLIALGGASVVGAVIGVLSIGLLSDAVHIAHWLAIALLCGLLVFLWVKAVSTKRGFVTASTIYIASKETLGAVAAPQKPWLGWPQWVALIAATLLLAVVNALLRGSAIAQIPALQVVLESVLVIIVTAAVCAVPATTYWLARRSWMPELTRFVWLVWIVVGFAFTYGNYLTTLDRI
jgi:hypothetical protein